MDSYNLISRLNAFVWGPWMLILMVGTGIFLTFKLNFFQFRKFIYALKNTFGKLFEKADAKEGEITPFQAVSTALANTVGTGNIAGVAGAIAMGGPGAVFWMWFSALFGMATKYAEIVLAVKYREKNKHNEWVGGPMYYIKNGLPKKFHFLATIFCFFAIFATIGTGGMTQINTIANSINTTLTSFGMQLGTFQFFNEPIYYSSLIIGMITAIIVCVVLFGGVKRIGAVCERFVPLMAVVYVSFALIVLVFNFQYIDDMLIMIVKGAFSPKAVLGGAVGVTIMSTIRNGVGRGVFSNEAGLGTAPMAHALTSETNPVKQGLYAIFEIFVDTLVICTLTSLLILCGYQNGVPIQWGFNAGIDLVTSCFSTVLGTQFSATLISICITLFALSTILSCSFYGAKCFTFLFGEKSHIIYQWLYIIGIVVGACLKLDIVWKIAETFNGFMAVPNLIALLLLSPKVIELTTKYFQE